MKHRRIDERERRQISDECRRYGCPFAAKQHGIDRKTAKAIADGRWPGAKTDADLAAEIAKEAELEAAEDREAAANFAQARKADEVIWGPIVQGFATEFAGTPDGGNAVSITFTTPFLTLDGGTLERVIVQGIMAWANRGNL